MSAASQDVAATTTLRVSAAATALVLVAFTMPLGLLRSIVVDLSAGSAGTTWVLSSMSVGLAASLLVAGSLADDLGRRRVFRGGLTLFAAGCVVGAVSPGVVVLCVARAAQGVGGAAVLASGLSLIAHAYPAGQARVHATGVWGAMLGVGIAIGPLGGALVAQLGSWRTSYAALSVLSVAALVPAARLTESRAQDRRPLDPVGTVLMAGGLTALTAGVVQGNSSGWTYAPALVALALATVLLAAFGGWELRSRAPLFDVRLLARPAFTGALLGSLALGVAVLAFMSYSVAFMTTALGSSVLSACAWTLPWSGVSFAVSIKARALGRVLSPRAQTVLGLVVCAGGLLAMRGLHDGSGPAHLAPGFAVLGVGTGLLNAALAQAAVSVVPASRSGMGAGANNTARYVGAALGVPLVVGLLRTGTASRLVDGHTAGFAATGAMNSLLLVLTAITVAGAAVVFVLLRPAQAGASPTRKAAI